MERQTTMNYRELLKDKKRIVIKVGSSSLIHKETGKLDLRKVEVLVRELSDLHNQGKNVVLVTSGAVAVGSTVLGLKERPRELKVKQACSAVGQARLMMIYQKLFSEYNQTAAQILMTKNTMVNNVNRMHARNTFEELLRLDVICSVGSREDAEVLEAAAERLGVTARAHVEIDTGMGRYGFLPAELPWILPLYRGEYAHIRVTGTYTHFHTAGHPKVTAHQFERFQQVLRFLQFMDCDPGMIHCCNSLAFWKYPQYHMDAVRLGSVFLGRVSYAEEAGLSRVGWVEAPIQEVREVQAGSNVGYGSACTVQEDTTLAVVGVGYYHGFAVERGYDVYRPQDCLRNMARYLKYMLTGRKLKVYIADTLCPVLGHVGMLNLVADVTGLECRPGDPVYIPVNPLDRKGMEIEYRPADQEGKPSSRFRP